MKQVNLSLYQVGSTAIQRETNPIEPEAHYLKLLPLRVRKKEMQITQTLLALHSQWWQCWHCYPEAIACALQDKANELLC